MTGSAIEACTRTRSGCLRPAVPAPGSAAAPRSPIEKSLFGALAQPGGEELSPGRGGGIAVSDGAGTVGPGS